MNNIIIKGEFDEMPKEFQEELEAMQARATRNSIEKLKEACAKFVDFNFTKDLNAEDYQTVIQALSILKNAVTPVMYSCKEVNKELYKPALCPHCDGKIILRVPCSSLLPYITGVHIVVNSQEHKTYFFALHKATKDENGFPLTIERQPISEMYRTENVEEYYWSEAIDLIKTQDSSITDEQIAEFRNDIIEDISAMPENFLIGDEAEVECFEV